VAGGAWCPAEPVGKDSTEYLQLDLGRLMVITLVETQGRFDNGQVGDIISRSLQIILKWVRYHWHKGQRIHKSLKGHSRCREIAKINRSKGRL